MQLPHLYAVRYVWHLQETKTAWPRRQEAQLQTYKSGKMPQETRTALATHEEVHAWAAGRKAAIVFSVSHSWETREHPDPCRYQLELVASSMSLYAAAYPDAELWIFYDYVSLFQFKRLCADQDESFRRSMGNMQLLYVHECTLTLRIETLTPQNHWDSFVNSNEHVNVFHAGSGEVKALRLQELVHNRTPYEERGWCMAEQEWSATRTNTTQYQCIDAGGRNFSEEEHDDEALSGKVPTTPEDFKARMERAAFTHRSDADSVVRLQENLFNAKVRGCVELALEGLPPNEINALANALPHYGNLKVLRLTRYDCGEEEAREFGEVGDLLLLRVVSSNLNSDPVLFNFFLWTGFAPCRQKQALARHKTVEEVLITRTNWLERVDNTSRAMAKAQRHR